MAVDLKQTVARIAKSLSFLLRRAGVSPEEFAQYLHEHDDTPIDEGARGGVNAELSPEALMYATATLAAWHQDSAYVDETGEPTAIPLEGPEPSLRSLYENTWRAHDLEEPTAEMFQDTVELLLSHSSIEQRDDNSYLPLSRSFLINARGVAINVLLERIADFSETIYFNGCLGGGRFDRVAKVSEFPVEAMPRVKSILEQHGMRFLEQIDNFLEDQKRAASDEKDTQEIGIGVYLIQRDE